MKIKLNINTKVDKNLTIDQLKKVLFNSMLKMQELATINCPVDKGRLKNSINLKDRVKIEEDGTKKLTLSASKRPISIARTETVRLANAGLKDMYIENDITTYRYLSAIDDRTSDICRELDGQVFLTKDGTPGVNMPPMHPMCRSSIVGLVN